MKAVLDTNCFIQRKLPEQPTTATYVPRSVENEIKDRMSKEYYELYGFRLTVRNPSEEYVKAVIEAIEGKHYGVSAADIDVVALTWELVEEEGLKWVGPGEGSKPEKVVCFTEDNGIKAALKLLNIDDDDGFEERQYKFRCYTCYKLHHDAVDFCKECGYPTITRVTVVVDENGNERVMLRKNYVHRKRVIRDKFGNEIKSAGQRQYTQHKNEKVRREKSLKNSFM